jgi:hypothetical protein
MKEHAIYDWSKFRESELYLKILLRWSNLLKDENLTEKEYHNFLFSHPSMFFTGLDSYLVISKLKLGSDYETDFVVVNEGYSDGTKYELIEIESPHTNLFNSRGNPSEKFNSALQQIRDWKRWLIDNKNQFRRIFPTQNTKIIRDSKLTFKIVIGRRKNENQLDLEKRRQIEEENNVEILSFDRLTDFALRKEYFYPFSSIISAQMGDVSDEKTNALANPFFKCITDSEWRKICRNGDSHIHSKLIDKILEIRTYNDELEEYIKNYCQ